MVVMMVSDEQNNSYSKSDETAISMKAHKNGLQLKRRWSKKGIAPMSEAAGIVLEKRDAVIADINGKVLFEQKDVLVPKTWSMTATNIVVSKYFRGKIGSKHREHSVVDLITRVVDTITAWGESSRYFSSVEDKEIFRDELAHLLINQKMAFNSPVWFNVGVEKHPQCSACFINSVDDTMESILSLAKTEGMLFKYGSGTGTNFSSLRGKRESLKSGGEASGPVSFMRGFDAFAGVIKSGGKTRRAAKMVILNVDHPDILEFIACKKSEEDKALALINAGYDAGFNVPGGAYDSVFFQNANHSVRVNEKFMNAVKNNSSFETMDVVDKKVCETFNAKKIWQLIAMSAWSCGDPGLQFDDVINRYHTCKESGRINASNPCSEYMFLDDSACNLASLNLMKFLNDDNSFDVESFKHAVNLTILAQEIIVDHASYPSAKIEANSHRYRPLGLGYANLGALLMTLGLPYDSDEGRAVAASITALMGGGAYLASSTIAQSLKPSEGFLANQSSFHEVMALHKAGLLQEDFLSLPSSFKPVFDAASMVWHEVESQGKEHGFRNCQVTVLAPTGTIGFMMDCDTTGIEPDIALVKYKKLVGGGMIKIVNGSVERALTNLGYSWESSQKILEYIKEKDTIEGMPLIKEEHLPVFDCAFKPHNGERSIRPMGHVMMMAAVQPFLSGAISKTVNMPQNATVEDIEDIYFEAWQRGLKAIAIYRDGCKQSQPVSTAIDTKGDDVSGMVLPMSNFKPLTLEDLIAAAKDLDANDELGKRLGMVKRRRLPAERAAITHKFSIAGHEGYLTVGLFEDGTPGELFCTMAKEGSTISGLMDVFATAISLALQYGVPLLVLVEKFAFTRFEPSGFTKTKEIPMASSVCDYIFRWLGIKFLKEDCPDWLVKHASASPIMEEKKDQLMTKTFTMQEDAPPCQYCGSLMVRSGSCYRCLNCGSTSGCS